MEALASNTCCHHTTKAPMKAMTCLPTLTKPVSAQVDALALGEGHARWREERPLAISSDSSSGGSYARNREEVNFARERGQNHMRAHIKAGIRAHRATLLIFIKLFWYLRLSFLSGQRSFCCDLPLSCFGAYKRGGGAHFEINSRHRQTP